MTKEAPIEDTAKAKQASTSPTVLVVEDDSFISLFLEQKFTEMQYHIIVAGTTAQARVALKENRIDVILLDIILPDENGFSFLEKLKKEEEFKHIPVIILSNLGQQSEIERGKQLGAIDFLVKGNYSPAEIVDRVAKILAARPHTP